MAETDIATASEQASALTEATPMAMLNQAVARGDGVEVLERLMGLQERWDAKMARQSFVKAFSSFKTEAVTVIRNKAVTDGPLKGKSYAELWSFVEAVTPALAKHDLSASWEVTRDEKDWIEVACVIEHVLGGSKRVTMGGPPDAGGAKNGIQARASTVTYLERYTLKMACGLAEQGDDKDGNTESDKITAEQAEELKALIDGLAAEVDGKDADFAAWMSVFLGHMKVKAISHIEAKNFGRAKDAIALTRRARTAK